MTEAAPMPQGIALFDVLAVNIKTGIVRLLNERTTKENAEAVVKFAVFRRGVEKEFYVIRPTGSHRDGDALSHAGEPT